jgi:hypothetical protein
MPPALRRALAVLAGVGVAIGIVFAVEAINARIYPLPPGTDYSDPEQMRAVMTRLPRAALVIVLLGWGLATVVGAWIAARVAGRRQGPAWTVGVVLLAAAVFNLLELPHPFWFWVAGVALFLPAAWLGARLAGAVQS